VSDASDIIAAKMAVVFEAVGPACVEIARDMISEQVQGHGFHATNRSLPGEPPHREYGTLQNDTAFEVESDGDVPVLEIYWTLDYAETLNNELDRPILEPLAERLQEELPALIAAEF
jgi:hypothetical protein